MRRTTCAPLRAAIVAALVTAGGIAPAAAEVGQRSAHVSLFATQWVHDNLLGIGVNAAARRLDFRDQYFVSVAYSQVLIRDLPILGRRLQHSSIELEGQLVQHFGLMHHPEATAAIVWRSPDAELPGGAAINLALGAGLSYAFEEPHLEGVRQGRDVQKLLSYLSFELELSHPELPGVSLVPRLHHRSGAFGLVGPRGDGSNYIGIGFRLDLP
jgi:hypothetical protein